MSTIKLSLLCKLRPFNHSYLSANIIQWTDLLTTSSTVPESVKLSHVQSSSYHSLVSRQQLQDLDQFQNCKAYLFNRFKPLPFDSSKTRSFHTSCIKYENDEEEKPENGENEENGPEEEEEMRDMSKYVKVVDLETSKRYLESKAYKTTYGDEPVWVKYRRNFKGQFAPKKTRVSCIDKGIMKTGNPCPICRDEYLRIDFRNVKLLRQFVSPFTDKTLPYSKTCLCQKKQRKMEVAIEKARIHGLLTFYVPFREYDYNEYYDFKKKKDEQ